MALPKLDIRSRRMGGAALLLALILANCRGDAPEPPRGGALEPGGTLRVALDLPTDLDPAATDDSYEASVIKQIFSGLLRWDDDLNIRPDIAESWIVSRDGQTYEFDLRSDARFHNGRPVTAEDFVYSFTRLLDPARVSPTIIQDYLHWIDGAPEYVAGTAEEVRGLTALGPHRLRIRLNSYYPSFLSVLCMDQARVVPREEVERGDGSAFAAAPVGVGPFRWVRRDDVAIVLARDPDYFGAPAFVDTLIFMHYPPDQGDRIPADLLAGRLDLVELRNTDIADLLGKAEVTVLRRPELSVEFLGLNVSRPPFDRRSVRRAVAMAMGRGDFERVAGVGYAAPVGFLPPGMIGYTPESKILAEDVEAARELLSAEGYGDGRPLRFEIVTASRGRHGALRDDVIRASLARAGIEVAVRYVDWDELSRLIDERNADAYLLSWVADLPDPDSFLYTLFSTRGTYNLCGYSEAEVDDMLDAGRGERNRERRLELYRQAERHILSDAPVIPLFNALNLLAFRNTVQGVEMSPIGLNGVPFARIRRVIPPQESTYAGL